jgi:hypothetical protein
MDGPFIAESGDERAVHTRAPRSWDTDSRRFAVKSILRQFAGFVALRHQRA